jgi:hypothetical protein
MKEHGLASKKYNISVDQQFSTIQGFVHHLGDIAVPQVRRQNAHVLVCQTLVTQMEHLRLSSESTPIFTKYDELIDKVYWHSHPKMHSFISDCHSNGISTASSSYFMT